MANWPQVWANINFPPQIVVSQAQADALGSGWRRLDFTPYLQMLPGTAAVTVSPQQAVYTNAAGGGSFTVTITNAGVSNSWIAEFGDSNDGSWITITAPTTPQTANGSVTYTVNQNNSSNPRTGHINVNNQRFEIRQAGR